MKALKILILSVFPVFSFAQTGSAPTPISIVMFEEINFGAITGVHFGKVWMGELGLAIGKNQEGRAVNSYVNLSTSFEFNMERDIYGIKIAAWVNPGVILPLSYGIATVSYFENNNFNQVLQPSFGFGIGTVQMVYNFNICLGRRRISALNSHQLSLRLYLPYIPIRRRFNEPVKWNDTPMKE